MSFLSAIDISASALTAQRVRMDVISQNIANIDTTRTESGQAYRRKVTVFSAKENDSFASILNNVKSATGQGVYVAAIAEDMSDFTYEYDPTHPDANAQGYVAYPNVNEVTEMVDMMAASRSYEANVTALNATKSMALKALEIGK